MPSRTFCVAQPVNSAVERNEARRGNARVFIMELFGDWWNSYKSRKPETLFGCAAMLVGDIEL